MTLWSRPLFYWQFLLVPQQHNSLCVLGQWFVQGEKDNKNKLGFCFVFCFFAGKKICMGIVLGFSYCHFKKLSPNNILF